MTRGLFGPEVVWKGRITAWDANLVTKKQHIRRYSHAVDNASLNMCDKCKTPERKRVKIWVREEVGKGGGGFADWPPGLSSS